MDLIQNAKNPNLYTIAIELAGDAGQVPAAVQADAAAA